MKAQRAGEIAKFHICFNRKCQGKINVCIYHVLIILNGLNLKVSEIKLLGLIN